MLSLKVSPVEGLSIGIVGVAQLARLTVRAYCPWAAEEPKTSAKLRRPKVDYIS